MSTLSYAVSDSATMLRHQLRHMLRYPSMTAFPIFMPVVFLLLFVHVFGGTMGAGLGGAAGGRTEYVNYVTPGIIMLAVTSVPVPTAVSVAKDMTEGIVARFRTMAISASNLPTPLILLPFLGSGFVPTKSMPAWLGSEI